MKAYWEFSQALLWLSEDALQVMLSNEVDAFRARIIEKEIESRHANTPSDGASARTAPGDSGDCGQA